MKSVLISIRPKWCELIASGKKTVEVRKTRPKLKPPFTCYIYCTKGNLALLRDERDTDERFKYDVWEYSEFHESCDKTILGGKVIGEFVCDKIKPILRSNFIVKEDAEKSLSVTCLSIQEAEKYAGWEMKPLIECYNKLLYGWHISDLVIYDKPKELSEFTVTRKCTSCKDSGYDSSSCAFDDDCTVPLTLYRPPQSWCYVEGI